MTDSDDWDTPVVQKIFSSNSEHIARIADDAGIDKSVILRHTPPKCIDFYDSTLSEFEIENATKLDGKFIVTDRRNVMAVYEGNFSAFFDHVEKNTTITNIEITVLKPRKENEERFKRLKKYLDENTTADRNRFLSTKTTSRMSRNIKLRKNISRIKIKSHASTKEQKSDTDNKYSKFSVSFSLRDSYTDEGSMNASIYIENHLNQEQLSLSNRKTISALIESFVDEISNTQTKD